MTDTNWQPKSAAQFAEDKKKAFRGDLTLCLLTSIEREQVDMDQLIQLMSRVHNFTDTLCHRANYRIVNHPGSHIEQIPTKGVLYTLEKFPIDALGEIEFQYHLFTLDPVNNALVPWDYKWTGPHPDLKTPNTFTLLVYPLPSHHLLETTNMVTIHSLIKPVIKNPQSAATVTPVRGTPIFKVELTLTESKDIHEKKIKDLRRELDAYKTFYQRWERFDKSSLADQGKALKEIRAAVNRFQSQLDTFHKESSTSQEVGKELKNQMDNRIDQINDELACLSGQEFCEERLVCIPTDNEHYHALLLEHPLQVLRHIRFLPLYFKNDDHNHSPGRQCYLLRFDPGQSADPVTWHFMTELETLLGKSFITFRPDRRWALMGIKVWLPEKYTLKPFFFNYREDEKEMARRHIREIARSVWGEESSEYNAINLTMSVPSPRSGPGAELVFIPHMQEEPGSKNWMSPGIAVIEEPRFKPLADNVKFLNAQQSTINHNYFIELFRGGFNTALIEFKKKSLLQGKLPDLSQNPRLMNLLATQWTGLLHEDIQKKLFNTYKTSVLKTAQTIIDEKTIETIHEVEKRLVQLQQERDRLLAEAESAQNALNNRYREWNNYYDKIQSAIDRYREKAKNAQKRYKGKWKAAKKRWNRLISKAKKLASLEAQFRKTEIEFSKLLGKLFLHLSVGVVTIIFILFIVYMFTKGGQT